jgi:HlyD family secretion protein
MTSRKWLILLLAVLAIAAAGYWIFQSRNVSANVSEKDLITVQRVDFPVIVSADGTLEALRSVSITAPQIRRMGSFKLMRIVEEGTRVTEGDFLMELDTSSIAEQLRELTANFQKVQENRQMKRSDFDIQLKNLKLSLEQAKADLEKLEVKLSSQVDLVSGIEIEETRIRRDAARKNVESLEKKLEYTTKSGQLDLQILLSNERHYRTRMDELMDAMDLCTVRAPVDGVVIYERFGFENEALQIGDNVHGSRPVMQIPDLSSIRARVQVDEVDAGKVKIGQEANIVVNAVQSRSFGGKVAGVCTILSEVSPDRPQKVCDTYVELDDIDEKLLRPEMNLKAQIQVDQYPQVVVVPLSSIEEREGRSFVQVWKPETKSFEWREIQLRTNDGLTAVVESGLNGDEKIRVKPKV